MGSHRGHGRAAAGPRPLTPREREILDHLLSVEAPGVGELRQQAETALATPWDCGCASIDLTVDRHAAPQSSIQARAAIEAASNERAEPFLELLLWVDDEGWLSAIEVVDYLDEHEESPEAIPPPTDFDPPRLSS